MTIMRHASDQIVAKIVLEVAVLAYAWGTHGEAVDRAVDHGVGIDFWNL